MDVVCDRCRAEYEFDDALVSERGTTVKCTNCGHQFKIYRMAASAEAARSWNLRRPDGTVIPFDSLAVLQKWILEGRVSKMDEICRGNEPWKPLGAIAELESFFSTAEIRASHVPNVPHPRPTSRPSPAASGRPTAREGTPPAPASAARSMPPAQSGNTVRPGGPPPVNTAHGYPVPPTPPSATRSAPTDHGRTAPVGTPVLPPRIEDDPPTTTVNTPTGFAIGTPSVAIGAPPPPVPSPLRGPSLEVPVLPPVSKPAPESHTDDEEELPAIKGAGGGSRGVVWALAIGLVLAGGVGLAAWRAGYLGAPDRAPPPASIAAPAQLDTARGLERRYTRQAFEDAREELARALATSPDSASVHAARAHVMAVWSEMLKQRADDLDARARLPGADGAAMRAESALLRRDAGERLDRARTDAQRAEAAAASRHGAERIAIEAALADVSRIGGDLAAARRHLDVARSEGPASPDSEVAAALIARESGEATHAIEGLRAAISRAGDHVRARLALARLLASQGDAAGARRELDAVMQSAPNHDDAQWLAQALSRGEAPMAAAAASSDGGAAPTAADVSVVVASNNAAVPTPNAGASSGPSSGGRSYEQLVEDGDRFQDDGRSGPARERYRQALQLRPSGAEALAGLGFVDLEDRELTSAISNFRRALNANPGFGEALIGLGEAYTSQSNYEQALAAYNRYLLSNPGGSHAHMARRQVESLQERLHGQDNGSGGDSGASGN